MTEIQQRRNVLVAQQEGDQDGAIAITTTSTSASATTRSSRMEDSKFFNNMLSSKLNPTNPNRRKPRTTTRLWSVAFITVVTSIALAVLFVTHLVTSLSSSPSEGNNIHSSTTRQLQQYRYHVIFSTGCTLIQDWQTYMFFFHALQSQQPGTITRIASGCSAEDQVKLAKLFDEQIASMTRTGKDDTTKTSRFRIHFTPDYSNLKKGVYYKYFNKPYGTKHWMEHALGFPNKVTPEDENAIVILMDPDQVIVRPFTNDDFFFNYTEWWGNTLKQPDDGKAPPRTPVQHGKPMGQRYGFGRKWKDTINLKRFLRDIEEASSPISKLTNEESDSGYVVGPPYIATARDMYQIASKWSEFVVPVHDQYPELLAEMYAYSLAAAHLRLPHRIAANFMVSEVTASSTGEGWSYVDTLSATELCLPQDPVKLPFVFHYCQRYGLGTWMFGKFRLPNTFLSCPHPLLKEPPVDIALLYNDTQWPDGTYDSWKSFVHIKRNAFGMCYMIRAANAAATYFKKMHCKDVKDPANYEKSLTFP